MNQQVAPSLAPELDQVERELDRLGETPPHDLSARLGSLLQRLTDVPRDPSTDERRIGLLLAIAGQYYLEGCHVAKGLDAVQAAVELATRRGAQPLLRRALSIQGLILGNAGHYSQAIVSLTRSLSIAQASDDPHGAAAAWLNLGVVFTDATLHVDARGCFQRAVAAVVHTEASITAYVKGRAFHGAAECSLWLHDWLRGLSEIDQALVAYGSPQKTEAERRQAEVLARCTRILLLLRLGRTKDAQIELACAREVVKEVDYVRAALAVEVASAELSLALGNVPDALDLLAQCREQSKSLPGIYVDHLRASATAYEKADLPDRALAFVEELVNLSKAAQQEQLRRFLADVEGASSEPQTPNGRIGWLDGETSRLRRLLDARVDRLLETAIRAALGSGHDLFRIFRVSKLAELLARGLGWADEDVTQLSLAAKLLDIGMIAIDKQLLLKDRTLTPAERRIVNGHTEFGEELLSGAQLPMLRPCAELARTHHECWDGSGPLGLKEEAIPASARLVTLCDTFDAMTHDRPWRPKRTVQAALIEIGRAAGLKFDPTMAARFIELVRAEYWVHEDFDEFLATDAHESQLVRARAQIAAHYAMPSS